MLSAPGTKGGGRVVPNQVRFDFLSLYSVFAVGQEGISHGQSSTQQVTLFPVPNFRFLSDSPVCDFNRTSTNASINNIYHLRRQTYSNLLGGGRSLSQVDGLYGVGVVLLHRVGRVSCDFMLSIDQSQNSVILKWDF